MCLYICVFIDFALQHFLCNCMEQNAETKSHIESRIVDLEDVISSENAKFDDWKVSHPPGSLCCSHGDEGAGRAVSIHLCRALHALPVACLCRM